MHFNSCLRKILNKMNPGNELFPESVIKMRTACTSVYVLLSMYVLYFYTYRDNDKI